MQTAQTTAVSQLANMPCLTLKALSAKGFSVRQTQNPSHTYAPTQEVLAANNNFENFDFKKANDFIALVKALYPLYSVAFSPNHYLQNEFENCRKEAFDLFLNLVQTFTLLHHQQRKTEVQNVLAATTYDYNEAYKLWLLCQPQKQSFVYLPTLQRVQNFIQYKYNNQPFTINKIAAQLNLSAQYTGKIFSELLSQNKIEFVQVLNNGTKIYQTKQP